MQIAGICITVPVLFPIALTLAGLGPNEGSMFIWIANVVLQVSWCSGCCSGGLCGWDVLSSAEEPSPSVPLAYHILWQAPGRQSSICVFSSWMVFHFKTRKYGLSFSKYLLWKMMYDYNINLENIVLPKAEVLAKKKMLNSCVIWTQLTR